MRDIGKGIVIATTVICITYLIALTGNMKLAWMYLYPAFMWTDM